MHLCEMLVNNLAKDRSERIFDEIEDKENILFGGRLYAHES